MNKFEAIILAGGKGTRVKKYTKKIPKCLININGKPFLYYQLRYLKENNIKNIIISTCYMSNKIQTYVKKNINFINVRIIDDGKPLGTGGAVLKSLKYLKNNFFIIYGDSYLNFKIKKIIKNNNLARMAIFKNNNNFDKSNIELKELDKIRYYKKQQTKKLKYIDYGVSYVNKKIFKVTKKKKFDLSDLYDEISKKNQLNSYIVKKRFYEIGSYSGIKDFENYLKKQ